MNSSLTEESEDSLSIKQVGALLQQHRVAKGLSLDDVSAQLKIRKFFLQNIEDGHFDQLPPGMYALWYVRSYAGFLGVDPLPVFALPSAEPVLQGTTLSTPSKEVPKWSLWLSSALAMIVLGIFMYRGDAKKIVPDEEVPPAPPVTVPAESPVEEVILVAVKETWVKIIDQNGQIIADRSLNPGERYRIIDVPNSRLSAGDKNAIEISLSGKKVSPPTNDALPGIEDLSLNHESLRKYTQPD
ncbi:MAG: DUF4115 domain-containing protein [Alphaproteobacteria bacterium]|nr:DUF4115 domain-containing protein [Alphaproteobacteria bacterium]